MTHEASAESFAAPVPAALDPVVSFPDYAASTFIEPKPAWRTLNVARERAFTGEIKFLTTPAIVAFVDGGSVYYAERTGDPSLCERLLSAGVVNPQQLERGVVRVGGAEHLGRLFDRDGTIDRDAVMVVVETATEQLVAQLAAEVVSAIEVGAYRHHQSGVHRWFVAPADPGVTRPVSGVAQVDRSVIDELPDVTVAPTEVTIEWDHPVPSDALPLAPPVLAALELPNADDLGLEAELGRFNADKAKWSSETALSETALSETSDIVADDEAWLGEFQIVWPDGTEESATPTSTPRPVVTPDAVVSLSATVSDSAPVPNPAHAEFVREPLAPAPAAPIQTPAPSPVDAEFGFEPLAPGPAVAPTPTAAAAPAAEPAASPRASAPEHVQFATPQIVVDAVPAPDADVPDDVAEAVRRALRAIENAAVEPATLSQIDLTPLTLPDLKLPSLDDAPAVAESGSSVVASDLAATLADIPTPAATPAVIPTPEAATLQADAPAAPAPQLLSGFAPPSTDTRAEAVYARAAADAAAKTLGETEAEPLASEPEASPEPGQASVVFLDEDDDAGKSRKGALRRLIGSLRKDR